MRQNVIDYISDVNPGGFFVSQELPWSESGVPLHQKNPKTIYVDVEQTETEDLIFALNGLNIQNRIQVVRVFFANDAKTLPPTYDDLVDQLRRVNDIPVTDGIGRRQVNISTTIENDLMTTELEYRFFKLLR